MTGRTHELLGMAGTLSLVGLVNYPISGGLLLGGCLGSLFPDCDCKTAPQGKLLPLWLIFRHRGIIHSFELNFIVTALFWLFVNKSFAIGWGIGVLLHILIDLLNKTDVEISTIFNIKLSAGLIKVGSGEEWLITTTIAIYFVTVLESVFRNTDNVTKILNDIVNIGSKIVG